MQLRPMHLFSQMTRHNVAPETGQDAHRVRSECEEAIVQAVDSQAPSVASREAKGRATPRRRLDPLGVLWKMIIRPPRAEYTVEELGPKAFRIPDAEGKYCREDIELRSLRGERLACSHFRALPAGAGDPVRPAPCVVYLHGNCSSRLEALDVLDELLPRGFSVFSFDFAGSGHSDGEYVTLGHNEEQDLKVVLDHLRRTAGVGPIALWGRSMGAATSVLRAAEDRGLAACVLDSPFCSLPDVARELAQSTRLKMPELMVGAMLRRIRAEIKARAGVDIEDLKPIEFAPRAAAPALFAVAKDDEFVRAHHTYALHDAWGGEERELVTLGGGHNSSRPREFHAHAADFLQERFGRLAAAEAALPVPQMQSLPQVICQLSDDSSTTSTRAPSRAESESEASLPKSPQPPSQPVAAAAAPSDLPTACGAALARAGLGSCLGGCLAGVRAGIAAAAPAGA